VTADIRLDDYDFDLPEARIAQQAAAVRDASRLMVLERNALSAPLHQQFRDLPRWLRPGDLLVINATQVLPARLRGHKDSGGTAEALLLARVAEDREDGARYRALVRTNGRLRPGMRFVFGPADAALECEIESREQRGEVVLRFAPGVSPYAVGEAPLPPYIRRPQASPTSPESKRQREDDMARYQTIFARVPGAVAAPTAGLHLSEEVLGALEQRGVERAEVVLHVGAGTFRPIGDAELASGRLHEEAYELPEATAQAVAATRARGGRVVAVGTTTTRVLETCATPEGVVLAGHGTTDLFLHPGKPIRVVDGLLTNFHLPKSSLLLLVAAFIGRERLLSAYREAIRASYRFYSYGDAMLIL